MGVGNEVGSRRLDAQDHVALVGDKDVSGKMVGIAYHRQQRKAAAEERMGRVGNLDLDRFFLVGVIEVGTKLMVRRARSAWTSTRSGSGKLGTGT